MGGGRRNGVGEWGEGTNMSFPGFFSFVTALYCYPKKLLKEAIHDPKVSSIRFAPLNGAPILALLESDGEGFLSRFLGKVTVHISMHVYTHAHILPSSLLPTHTHTPTQT